MVNILYLGQICKHTFQPLSFSHFSLFTSVIFSISTFLLVASWLSEMQADHQPSGCSIVSHCHLGVITTAPYQTNRQQILSPQKFKQVFSDWIYHSIKVPFGFSLTSKKLKSNYTFHQKKRKYKIDSCCELVVNVKYENGNKYFLQRCFLS